MEVWKKSGEYTTLAEFMAGRYGLSIEEIVSPQSEKPETIKNVPEMAELLINTIKANIPIIVIGDYDVDGITATAILKKTINMLGADAQIIIPRRFTDGYGISSQLISNIFDSLIITVDNGIAAAEAVAEAKMNGNTVAIVDHHLPQDILPGADLIVDPHTNPDENSFTEYCGAGLAYKIAQFIHERNCFLNDTQMDDITVLACIGTIADVMPLIGDNRRIVLDGLGILNDTLRFNSLSAGIREVMQLASSPYNEETIKFSIGPIMNAPGRLYDAGSSSVFKEMINTDDSTAAEYAEKMKEINEKRKLLVSNYAKQIDPYCEFQSLLPIIVLFIPDVPEGIVGILTGKIAEKYRRPAFVFTNSRSDKTLYKGSGRTYGGCDLSELVNKVLPLCESGGGHAGAAGLSVRHDNFRVLAATMIRFAQENNFKIDTAIYYDLEIMQDKIPEICEQQKEYMPFGEGIERPVFFVRNFTLVPNRYGDISRRMGNNNEHIKLFGGVVSAVGFNFAEKYADLNSPSSVDLICTIDENIYKGTSSPQLNIIGLRPAAST